MIDLSALWKMSGSAFTRNTTGYFVSPDENDGCEKYGSDLMYFELNPDRRLRLRAAPYKEFDIFDTVEEYHHSPFHYVLVTKLARGFHRVECVFVGTKHCEEGDACETDEDVARLLQVMQKEEGIDKSEVGSWIAECAAESDAKKTKSNNTKLPLNILNIEYEKNQVN